MEVALDCEMIGIKGRNTLAQVSIVDKEGKEIYNEFVKPPASVNYNTIDYRTSFSGITKEILQSRSRLSFDRVQSDVKGILAGKIIVGHALENDFRALGLNIRDYEVRDTAHTPWFMQIRFDPRSLKRLASELLGKPIQMGSHNALEDAQISMELYRTFQDKFTLSASDAIADRFARGEKLFGGGTRRNRRKDRRRRRVTRRVQG